MTGGLEVGGRGSRDILRERERVHVERWKVGKGYHTKEAECGLTGLTKILTDHFFKSRGEREGGVGGTVVHCSAPVGMGWILAQNHF